MPGGSLLSAEGPLRGAQPAGADSAKLKLQQEQQDLAEAVQEQTAGVRPVSVTSVPTAHQIAEFPHPAAPSQAHPPQNRLLLEQPRHPAQPGSASAGREATGEGGPGKEGKVKGAQEALPRLQELDREH